MGSLQFNPGASGYTFSLPGRSILYVNGAGIQGTSSTNAPTFNVNSNADGSSFALNFIGNGTTAGYAIINNYTGGDGSGEPVIDNIGGGTQFDSNSTADHATITNYTYGATYFFNGSTAASAQITNDGGLTLFADATAGNASIRNINGGTLKFYNTSTAGNATIINDGGEVFFLGGTTAGSANITNSNSGYTRFLNQSTGGNAKITNNSGGYTNFEDTSAGNAIIYNSDGGQTNFYYTGSAGNAVITTTDGGSTNFYMTSSGGAARFITDGTGFVDFSGLTSGGATAGSIEGSGTYYLGGNKLTVGSLNSDTTLRGTISDGGASGGVGGSLVKVGTGTLTLAGTNIYTGDTTVSEGALNVTGSIASSSLTTVNAGGILTGTGTLGNTMIETGGFFVPGNGTAGTAITVSGDLTFQSGAQYVVNINPATSSRTNVSGTATLGGASVNAIYANGSYVERRYTILTAGSSVNGTFNGPVNTNLPTNFSASLAYDANNAYLDLTLNYDPGPGSGSGSGSGPGPFGGSLNINQRNVASTLVNHFNTAGGVPLAFGALTPAGLTQVSGELATGTQQTTFTAMDMFTGLLTDPHLNQAYGEDAVPAEPRCAEHAISVLGYAAEKKCTDAFETITKAPARSTTFESRWSLWTAGFGGSQMTDGNAATGSNDTRSAIYGVAVGADYLFSPDTLAGFALAGGGTNFSVNGLGSGRSDLFQTGAFVRHNMGAAYLTGALAYGWQDITTDRALAGVDRLQARFNANAFSGRLEGGYRVPTAWGSLTPYAAGQFTTYDLPDYAEQPLVGSDMFALTYGAKTVTASRSELGLRSDRSFALADGALILRGRLAWAHNFDPNPSIDATFQTLPGTTFVVNGASIGSNSALTTASAERAWRNGWSTAATFDGEFSDVTRTYAGKAKLRYQW